MSSADPPKHKRSGRKGDSPTGKPTEIPQTPANDAGVSVFGVPLDAAELSLGAQLSQWTVIEATYLTAGCKPPRGIEANANSRTDFDWLHEPLLYRETLLRRHLQAADAGELIAPLEALLVLQRLGQWIDPRMLQAVQSYQPPSKTRRIKMPKASLGDFMDASHGRYALESDEPEAATKRILTLLKYLLAMAIDKYGYVPNRHGNPSAGRIVLAMEKIGLKGDDGTVSSYLKWAVEEHWTEPGG